MAGIGFELRRLIRQDDLMGVIHAYGYSALATSGPWLFTICALSAIVALGTPATTPLELATFRSVVVYNFAFSLVLSGAITTIATRRLADYIYEKDVRQAPALMVGCLILVYAVSLPLAGYFYLLRVHLDPAVRLLAILNFMLVSGIWSVGIFLTALKNYHVVTWAFLVGMAISVITAGALAYGWAVAGMLTGFNAGLAFIFVVLVARVFAEYPTRAEQPLAILPYFRRYWDLALAALLYNAAVWVDKWVMWLSPRRESLASGLFSYPDYDGAMFLAYLSVIPAMAAFTLTVETGFYEQYRRFYGDIQRHVSYERIASNHRDLIQSFLDGSRNFLVLQGSISLTAIMVAPQLFVWLGIGFRQLGIFRLGLAGAFFQAGYLFLSILLSYFDQRQLQLKLGALLLLTNGVFTFLTLRLGFAWYGYGYFLSSLITFGVAFITVGRFISSLPYHAFITMNSSIQESEG
jgi:uncharacterized membrane protein